MKFFDNPRRKRRRRSRKRRTAAQRRATAKLVAFNRRRRRVGKKRRRRTTLTTPKRRRRSRRPAMARRRRRRTTARRKSYRRRRRGGTIRFRRVRGAVYKRNPGIVNMVMRGVMDGATVVGGKAVAGFIGNQVIKMLPAEQQNSTIVTAGVKVVSAIGVGFLASRFLGADRARLAVAGAFAAPIEAMVKQANVPLLSEGLSDDADYYEVDMSGYPALSGYPAVSAIPGVGDTEDDYEYAYQQ